MPHSSCSRTFFIIIITKSFCTFWMVDLRAFTEKDNKHCDYVNNHSLGLHCVRRANILIHRIVDARVQEQRQIVQLCRHLCCNLLIELPCRCKFWGYLHKQTRWSFLQNIAHKFSVWTKSFLCWFPSSAAQKRTHVATTLGHNHVETRYERFIDAVWLHFVANSRPKVASTKLKFD